MSEIETPSYMLKGSDRVKDALRQLPVHPMAQSRSDYQLYTEFEILDSLRHKIHVIQYQSAAYSDRPSEGVASFDRGFQRGWIAPDGEVTVLDNEHQWRQAIIEYHGGWIITVLNHQGGYPPRMLLKRAYWGSLVAAIEDTRMRHHIASALAEQGAPDNQTFVDYLKFCHDLHVKQVYHGSDRKVLFV